MADDACRLVEVQSLDLKIENVNLMTSVSFSVSKGERVGISGPSGCGKSTLIKSVINKYPPNGSSFEKFELLTSRLAYMPQKNGLFPWFTIKKNIEFSLKQSQINFSSLSSQVNNILIKFGIEKISRNYPHQVSGGEYQRAIIACSVSAFPDLLLSDEPFTGLDNKTKWSALESFSEILDEGKVGLLLISHDVDTLFYMCDRVIVLGGENYSVISDLKTKRRPFQNRDALTTTPALVTRESLFKTLLNGTTDCEDKFERQH